MSTLKYHWGDWGEDWFCFLVVIFEVFFMWRKEQPEASKKVLSREKNQSTKHGHHTQLSNEGGGGKRGGPRQVDKNRTSQRLHGLAFRVFNEWEAGEWAGMGAHDLEKSRVEWGEKSWEEPKKVVTLRDPGGPHTCGILIGTTDSHLSRVPFGPVTPYMHSMWSNASEEFNH